MVETRESVGVSFKSAVVPDERSLLNEAMECPSSRSLDTKPLADDQAFAFWQGDIPSGYWKLTAPEIVQRIRNAKEKLGRQCVILGHHYQREDVIQFADLKGDSYKLSQWASQQAEAKFILFCGVHFMAEAAHILAGHHQKVILPNMSAGCSMADMAEPEDVYACWDELHEAGITDIVPVTYINSAATLKAFCGKNGGIVCTSSNAARVYEWALARGRRVLFFPDQHLGRNTAVKHGLSLDQTVVWDYSRPYGGLGGNGLEALERSTVILWKGHCSVHNRFKVAQIDEARARYPDINIIVHPECHLEVVQAADFSGSTEVIAATIREAPAGSKWAVGTEINLVSRLAHENPDKVVFCLDPVVCPCSTMYRIHPAYLCWAVESLAEGRIVNQVKLDDATRNYAKIALDRMLTVR